MICLNSTSGRAQSHSPAFFKRQKELEEGGCWFKEHSHTLIQWLILN